MTLTVAVLDGRIELRGLTGRGGMGEVHRAWDHQLERAVAVKFTRAGDDRESERLLLEARLQARVVHSNVIQVHEVGTLGGRACIVFQLVDGPTLGELAPDLDVEERVELLRQAALGLQAAHMQGLIHRDVKPGNILVEQQVDGARRALLGDFGLARAEEGGLTRTGVPVGTVEYMSPEQLLGSGPVDFRSDVYSLGATLYALVAGRPPFRTGSSGGGPDHPSGLFRRVLDSEPEALHAVAPGTPRELGLVAAKAMEKDPGARYASAEEFAEELRRHLAGEPLHARPPSPGERVYKWSRRNRAATRAIASGGLAILVAAGFAAWTGRRATLDALEAARLGAEAAEMEGILRVEALLPAHDLRPAFARIRAMMAGVAATTSGGSAGAAAFTLGRGHQLLGESQTAYRELTRAWELGFRTSDAARALGETEGQLYALELLAMGRFDDPARKQERIDALARRYRDPAVARLRSVTAENDADRLVIGARLALVERRFDEAAALAQQAAEAGANPLEAGEIEGQARLDGAWARYEQRDLPAALAGVGAARASLERTVTVGRSAPVPRLLLSRALLLQYRASIHDHGMRLDPLDAIVALLAETERIHPDSSELHVIWSAVDVARSEALASAGEDPEPALRSAVAQGEKAVAVATDRRQPYLQLANACASLAIRMAETGQDPRAVFEKGIGAAEGARAVAPESHGPYFNLAFLRTARSQWMTAHGHDGRPEADAGLADARHMLEIGARPVMARLMVGEALEAVATAGWRTGADPDPPSREAVAIVTEAIGIGPKDLAARASGVQVAGTWAELALAEGRPAFDAFEPGLSWADSMWKRAEGNPPWAVLVGRLLVLRGRAALLGGGDPSPWIDRAVPMLERATATQPAAWLWLGEAELARADRARARGGDPRPHLARAESFARRLQDSDPAGADGPLLEARAIVSEPGARRARLLRGLDATRRALAIDGRRPQSWAVDARLRVALQDRDGARASLERAAALQPRLAELTGLRAMASR